MVTKFTFQVIENQFFYLYKYISELHSSKHLAGVCKHGIKEMKVSRKLNFLVHYLYLLKRSNIEYSSVKKLCVVIH